MFASKEKNSPVMNGVSYGLSNMSYVKICPKENDLHKQLCVICQMSNSLTMDEVHKKFT